MPANAQHLRIFACAIANDSAGAFMGGSSNGSGLYQSDDTGKTWRHLGWDNIKCYSMDEVQSSNGRILYESTGLGVLRSTDFGEHWKQLTDWRVSEVMDIAVNQKNPLEIYIATAHGPCRSTDGGSSWISILQGLPAGYCSRVVIDSLLPGHVILATEDGLFALPRGRLRWHSIPVEQTGTVDKVERTTNKVRFVIQISADRWMAACENSHDLISSDSAKSFGTLSVGDEGHWSIAAFSHSKESITVSGGPNGRSIMHIHDDVIGHSPDARFKNVSALLELDTIYDHAGISGIGTSIIGTLGEGVIVGSNATLLKRQIWTLKSFIINP